jgi:DNA-binding SARP family transcriptional activator/tetratricopeptide (TPR) repeat protein
MVAGVQADRLIVRLLGPPEILVGDRMVSLSSKAIGLIAYLALQSSHPLTREVVLELFWPDSPLDSGRKNLRNTLWSIRRAMGEHTIVADDERLGLGQAAWVDVHEFEDAVGRNPRTAIDLYRGAFLDGVSFADAAELELWIDNQRRRLAQLHVRALTTAAELFRARESWHDLIRVADRAIAEDNVHEPMYRALMEGYARLGERGEALRRYDTLRDSLDRELGVTPLAETRALRDAIANGRIRPMRVDGRHYPERRPGFGPTPPIPFVGRVSERAALDTALGQIAGGVARVCLITGELGIGKSRLWQEWAATLPSSATVLEARCLDATQSLPFAPLVELLGNAELRRRIQSPTSTVAPVWLAEVGRLAPDLLLGRTDLPPATSLPTPEERGRVFEGLAQVFLALGGCPIVLFVDDVHWADRTTLEWLRFVVHRLRATPLLLVVAYRPDEASAHLVQLGASWLREGLAHRLPLTRLTAEEEHALGAAVVGDDPSRVERARQRAGGNPFFLLELLRSPLEDVPPVLSALIQARLDRLSELARQVIQVAAALDPDFDAETLRRASGREEDELLDALDELLAAGIVVERQAQLSFSHPLIPAVVRDGLSGPRRSYVFRRAAEALADRYRGRQGEVAGRLVRLYLEASDRARAAVAADQAAEQALAIAAIDEAVDFYRQAIQLAPTPARRAALARVLVRLGSYAEARSAFEQALNEFEAAGDVAGAAQASVGVAESYLIVGRTADVDQWAKRTLALLDNDPNPVIQTFAHLLMGMTAIGTDRSIHSAPVHLEQAVQLAEEHGLADLASRAAFGLGNFYAERGELAVARQLFHRAAAHARRAGDHNQEVLAYNNAAYHALLAGDREEAYRLVDRALALLDAYAFRLPRPYVYSTRGEIALADGKLDEAFEWLTRALNEAELAHYTEQRAGCLANLALVERERGNLDAAVVQLEAARAALEGITVLHLPIKIELWLSETYEQRGELAAAEALLRRAETLLVDGDRRLLQEWATRLRHRLVAGLCQRRN